MHQQPPLLPLRLPFLHAKWLLRRQQLLPALLVCRLPPLLLLLHLLLVARLHSGKRQRGGSEALRLRTQLCYRPVQLPLDLHQGLDLSRAAAGGAPPPRAAGRA